MILKRNINDELKKTFCRKFYLLSVWVVNQSRMKLFASETLINVTKLMLSKAKDESIALRVLRAEEHISSNIFWYTEQIWLNNNAFLKDKLNLGCNFCCFVRQNKHCCLSWYKIKQIFILACVRQIAELYKLKYSSTKLTYFQLDIQWVIFGTSGMMG